MLVNIIDNLQYVCTMLYSWRTKNSGDYRCVDHLGAKRVKWEFIDYHFKVYIAAVNGVPTVLGGGAAVFYPSGARGGCVLWVLRCCLGPFGRPLSCG